jgi:purine-nucleoside phosphorylase
VTASSPSDAVAGAVELLRDLLPGPPRVMLVLGSGLGAFADAFADAVRVPFDRVPGFASATVAGHRGALVAGHVEGVSCVALQGRYHLYEGHDPAAVVHPLRVLARLGAGVMIVTNAAGGIRRTLRPGDLMIIEDHINFMWRNPLTGRPRPGEARFPDMAAPYDPALQRIAVESARSAGIPVTRGVYAAVLGPSYETRAEVRMLERCGADAVGMSTVPEVIAAAALGVRCLGLSLVTNAAAGLAAGPLSHEEVVAAGEAARDRVAILLRRIIERLPAFLPRPGSAGP